MMPMISLQKYKIKFIVYLFYIKNFQPVSFFNVMFCTLVEISFQLLYKYIKLIFYSFVSCNILLY